MPETVKTHAVVIGSGPGGYVCAIRLAQLGVDAVLVEKGELGGVCLNVGCIPSKALISASKLVAQIRDANEMGIHVDGLRVDLREMLDWKARIVAKLTGGVGNLVEGNGARIIAGTAAFDSPKRLTVTGRDGRLTPLEFETAVIATGSLPTEIPGFAFDGTSVVSSTEALAFETLPKRMVVIGGGYIGMEMGGVYQRLGTEVTVVEYLDQLLPGFAPDLVRPVSRRFKKAGGQVLTKTRAASWTRAPSGEVALTIEDRASGETRVIAADVILSCVGRRPNVAGLAIDKAGLSVSDDGFIEVDGAQRTSVDHIFAIGDVAGEPLLAHKASKEGEVCAEVIAGHPAAFDLRAIPAVVFTDPEIATVGLSQEAAEMAGHTVVVGKFSFAANGRALSLGDAEGFVRVIADADSHVLLGVEAVGPEVTNLIAEAGIALEMGALVGDIGWTIHAHPTLSEVVMEAANAALGKAVHSIQRRR